MEQSTKAIQRPTQVTFGTRGNDITIEPYSEWVYNLLRDNKIAAGCTEGMEDTLGVPLAGAQEAIDLLTAEGTHCVVPSETRELIAKYEASRN